MHPSNLKNSLGCIADKDQIQVFKHCSALKSYKYKNL